MWFSVSRRRLDLDGRIRRALLCLAFSVFLMSLSGCASAITGHLMSNLSSAILNANDLETVESGGPAYLLMIDGLLVDDPDDPDTLRAAANLYTAYTTLYVHEEDRAKRLMDKALDYAMRAFRQDGDFDPRTTDFKTFTTRLRETDEDDLPSLYVLGSAWAGWIQSHRDDWNAVAELSRVESLMTRVVELDETHQNGGAHLYLGILSTMLPPALGGKPEAGRAHFERAIALSGGKNLMVKVTFARQYARGTFNRELHDQLLKEVLAADPRSEGYTLLNTLAQREARELLTSADDFF